MRIGDLTKISAPENIRSKRPETCPNIKIAGQLDLLINGWAVMSQGLLVAGLVVLLAGCATHRGSSIATATRNPQGRYEIRLDKVEWVSVDAATLCYKGRPP